MQEEKKSLSKVAGEGTAWTSFGNVITKGTTILSTLIVLRTLNAHEYGLFQLALTVFTFGGLFILSNLHEVIVTDASLEKEKDARRTAAILKGYFRVQMALAAAVWIAVFFGASYIGERFFGEHIGSLIQIVSLFFLLAPVRMLYTNVFTVFLQFKRLTIFNTAEELFRVILIFFALAVMKWGVIGLAAAHVGAQAFNVIALLPFYRGAAKVIRETAGEEKPIINILARHGKWAFFLSYVSYINKSLRVWLIKIFMNTEAVGLYSVAVGLIGHVRSFLPFENVITPIIPQYIHDTGKISRILSKSFKYLTAGFLMLGVIALLAFPPLITFLFPHYAQSIPLYNVMLLSLFPTVLSILVTPVFYSLRRQKSLFFSYLTRILMSLAFMPLLVKWFGIMGTAYEFVLTNTLFALERYYWIRKDFPYFKISLASLFSIDEYDKMILGKMGGALGRLLRAARR